MGESAFIWALGFVISLGTPNWYTDEALCIVEAIHFESNGEGLAGKRGVANVLQTRHDHDRFPGTYCGVLDAPGAFDHIDRGVTLKDVVLTEPGDIESFVTTLEVARRVLEGELIDNTGGATHFYNWQVSNPFWATSDRLTQRIGRHQYVDVYPR